MSVCDAHNKLAPLIAHIEGSKLCQVVDLILKVAPSRATVLITGETGTGKELVARTIHELSPRKSKRFIALNCAAIPESLMESEIFGHEKGAFTGAVERRVGCFELADGGTLLLDEIGEMPIATQAKLLRVLEDSKVRRLGSKSEISVDVRVLASTNKVPKDAVAEGHLRSDLFFRLNVVGISMPPLRERLEDLEVLVPALLEDLNHKHGCSVRGVEDEILQAFRNYSWPGNGRELRNVLERALVYCDRSEIEVADLPVDFIGLSLGGKEGRLTEAAIQVGQPLEVRGNILLYIDDRFQHHEIFKDAINQPEFLAKVRRALRLDEGCALNVEAWYPSDIPKDPPGLRSKLADVLLLVLDQNFDEDKEPWKNGRILYAYIAMFYPDLATRTLMLTRHGDPVRMRKYTEEMRHELATDPLFRDDVPMNALPAFLVRAPDELPIPDAPHWMWEKVHKRALQALDRYLVSTRLSGDATVAPQTSRVTLGNATQLPTTGQIAAAIAKELAGLASAASVGRIDQDKRKKVCEYIMMSRHKSCRELDRAQDIIVAQDDETLEAALQRARELGSQVSKQMQILEWHVAKPRLKSWRVNHAHTYGLDQLDPETSQEYWMQVFRELLEILDKEGIYWHMRGEERTPVKNNPAKFIKCVTGVHSRRARLGGTA